jgi:serine/threonine protein kinase
VIAGRYSLSTEIGRGGMGIVWRGQDEVLEREVALKRIGLAPGGTTPDLQRAEREARLAATLHHPNVVSVFDLAVDGDEHWLVMEYVESRNLAQIVKDRGPLPPDSAAGLLAQIADALAAAHERGIVHRDVKPSNILVTPSGQAKITDFGIARARADVTLTQTGMVTGSPAYLAPEVASGEQASSASDVWSLGATLYHALAGHTPYDVGENVVGALYRIVHEDPPRLSAAEAGWLAPVLEATMAKDKAARWTMAQVRDVLRGGPDAALPQVHHRTRTITAETRTERVPGLPPVASPSIAPEPRGTSTRRPGRAVAWLVAAAVLLAVLVLAIVVGNRDDSPTASGPRSPSASATTKDTPSDSPSPSSSPSTSSEAPTEDQMQQFVEDYLATAPSDPATTWKQLTPGFQRKSGGFGSYSGFWSQFESATPGDISADPDRLLVSYGVTYVKKSGGTVSDSVTLQLEQDGDGLLIAGES